MPTSDQITTAEAGKEGVFQAELSEPGRRRGPIPWARAIFALLFLMGVVAPSILFWIPSERAKWRIADSQARWLEGDLAGAIHVLDVAVADFPDNRLIREQRLRFCLEAHEFDKALQDADRLVSLTPQSPLALGLQSQVLHHLGRHSEAIAVCHELLRLAQEDWVGSAPTALNSLAYAQAIGDTQLDEALEHIDEALRLAGDNPAMLDTRGYIKYRLGQSAEALDDFKRAVETWEKLVAYQESRSLTGVRSYQSAAETASYQQSLAVMLYHRSLAYDRLGMSDEAKHDRERVRNLGYEPDDHLF